ncbi:MAG: radical SAM protein [candidate division WOR-3 bacterium]|nr:MAG: radical SAM protein [candidate division WOR-3 bacterium]
MARSTQKIRTALHNPASLPSMVWRRLSTTISYNFSSLLQERSSPPETVNIYPTDRCNLQCSMCFVKLRKPAPEMEIEQWCEIINQIKAFRPRIHLSGGEPFCYPAITDLIACVKKYGLFLAITTNGTYLDEYAQKIVAMKVNRINISIDGPSEIHDKIRGVPGTFDRVVNGLQKTVRSREKRKLPELQIHSMINFSDPGVMEWIIRFAIDMHADAVKFLYPLFVDSKSLNEHRQLLKQTFNRDLDYWRKADMFTDKPTDFTTIRSTLELLKKESRMPVEIFPVFNPEHLMPYYHSENNFSRIYKGRCRAMWNTATILSSGNLESCPDYILGNCRHEPFLSLWNNDIMRSLRHRIKRRQFFGVCRACCFYYQ